MKRGLREGLYGDRIVTAARLDHDWWQAFSWLGASSKWERRLFVLSPNAHELRRYARPFTAQTLHSCCNDVLSDTLLRTPDACATTALQLPRYHTAQKASADTLTCSMPAAAAQRARCRGVRFSATDGYCIAEVADGYDSTLSTGGRDRRPTATYLPVG